MARRLKKNHQDVEYRLYRNPIANVALLFAIVSLIVCWVPYLNCVTSVAVTAMSLVALSRAPRQIAWLAFALSVADLVLVFGFINSSVLLF